MASCSHQEPKPATPAWTYADLNILDPVDASMPSQDLVALYSRMLSSTLQIRLDLLDFTTNPDFDLYVALDYAPGGESLSPTEFSTETEWDILLAIPASGELRVIPSPDHAVKDVGLHVTRDPFLDMLVINLKADKLVPQPDKLLTLTRCQVYTTPPGSTTVSDSLGPSDLMSRITTRAPVFIAFWNSFPAATPAQALRRWNGAHTGPHGDRHGLRNLLKAVEYTQVPVALLDIKSPASLSALDFIGELDYIRNLAERELVLMPDIIPIMSGIPGQPYQPPGWVIEKAAVDSRQIALNFDIPGSQFLYYPGNPKDYLLTGLPDLERKYPFWFIASERDKNSDPSYQAGELTIARWKSIDLASLPIRFLDQNSTQAFPDEQQASANGPSLDVRKALVNLVVDRLSQDEDSFLLLGGNLTRSTWGEPLAARNTLLYLSEHPWVWMMTSHDLLPPHNTPSQETFHEEPSFAPVSYVPYTPQGIPLSSGLTAEQIQAALLDELSRLAPGAVTQQAWESYYSLLSPVYQMPADLAYLRSNYLGQVGYLIAAAQWTTTGIAEICSEIEENICLSDVDWDGLDEIILADKSTYTILEKEGGYIPVAFTKSHDQVHQFIAPSSQFTVGLSDSTLWDYTKGIAGDPSLLRGAYSDTLAGTNTPSWEVFQVQYAKNQVYFRSPNGALIKSFNLTPSGMIASYKTDALVTVQMPVLVNPEDRYLPDWSNNFCSTVLSQAWLWGLCQGSQVIIQTSSEITGYAFSDSYLKMQQPEDPNYAYPPGHFLPFPMGLGLVNSLGEYNIQIEFHQ